MIPKAEVIAYTTFVGVPEELLDIADKVVAQDLYQDKGTDAERLIECAGRTCYDSYSKGRSSKEYHNNIITIGHGSVLEHASISFFLSNISRGCTHELVRHRSGVAISQRSTRYVNEDESEWAWHPLIAAAYGVEKVDFPNTENTCKELYQSICQQVERHLVEKGVDKITARKQARGAARGTLGNALSTEMVWTANIRALRHVIEMRASEFADAEIRLLANALLDSAFPYCPAYFSDYEKVPCPDGIGYAVKTDNRKI